MPILPAFCNDCGAEFSSGFYVENVTNLTLSNNTAGPCPICGGTGKLEDGVFNVINGVVSKLREINYSKDELVSLIEILELYQSEDSNNLDNTQKPHGIFAPILELLPKNREEKGLSIKYMITTLLTILGFFISQSNDTTVNYNVNINQVINSSKTEKPTLNYEQINVSESKSVTRNQALKKDKIGRNELCPCGSGLKYKRCHGW